MKEKMRYCTKCMMPSTRPRLTFNAGGVCSACQWAEEKKDHVNWKMRWDQLLTLCEKYKKLNPNGFNCIVPVSGGKDGSYVAYKMKYELGMTPLCVTVNPPLQTDLGKQNLERFVNSGFDLLSITPNPRITKIVSKKGFVEYGQPLHSWMINVQTALFRIAIDLKIPFVIFGEEGETEYGGTTKLKHNPCYDIDYSKNVYLSGYDPDDFFKDLDVSENERYWWVYPDVKECAKVPLAITHWSYFENWDSYKHYLLAKEKCGLLERSDRNISTYNTFAQNDTYLYDLHTYIMYLKFGFGRCTTDVGIDIRRGAMSREEAVEQLKKYDGEYPEPYIQKYLDFFEMTQKEFDSVLDKFVNRELFKKVNGRWKPLFVPQ